MYKTGYLTFVSDAPMVGLPDHPAYAPDGDMRPTDAAGFAEAYNLHEALETAQKESIDDHEARLQAVLDGDLEDADDADFIMAVKVYDDGRVDVFANGFALESTATYSAYQIYDAFGMTPPATDDPTP